MFGFTQAKSVVFIVLLALLCLGYYYVIDEYIENEVKQLTLLK